MKHPLSQASLSSRITFSRLIKTFLNGYRRELTESDLFPPQQRYTSSFLLDQIHKHWKKEIIQCKKKPGSRPSLLRLIIKSFGSRIMILGMILLIVDTGNRIGQPFLIVKLLSYFSSENEMTQAEAASWASALLLSMYFQAHVSNYIYNSMVFVGIQIKTAFTCLIYQKILKISMISMAKNTTLGQIINLITNDVNTVQSALPMFHYLWIAPIQIVIIVFLLWKYVSLSAATGTYVFLLFLSIQVFFGMMAPRVSRKAAIKTDERLRLINEIINCVQVIKMFAWEKSFIPLLENARKEEMKGIKKTNLMKLNSSISFSYISKVALITSLHLCIASGQSITAELVFLLTSLFNTLQSVMCVSLANCIQLAANALASIRRIEDFMMHDEIRYKCRRSNKKTVVKVIYDTTPIGTVKLENISARWSPETKEVTLRDINFVAKCGSLTSVIGQVASGKSSLLHVILHELPTIKGSVNLSGNIAYVSQESWILNSSIRQNILFNLPMEKARYEEVVKVCQLERDFSLFPHSDQTIIGEKGINLSGGQKARVALARAVYQDADIYLLDDPLSAVDTRVGRLIFESCICNFLKNKTRILVTHQLQYLKDVDYIYVLNGGRVEREGTYQEVKESLGNLLVDDEEENVVDGTHQRFRVDDFFESGSIISDRVQEEQSESDAFGNTSKNLYLAYFKSVGSVWLILLYSICIVAQQTILSGSEYFISYWATILQTCGTGFSNTTNLQKLSDANCPQEEHDSWWYLYICSGVLLVSAILSFVEVISICRICEMASQGLHASMFYAVIRGAMTFFYKNSTGRILNRFSKDLGAIDKEMPKCLSDVIRVSLNIVAVMILCFIVNYWFILGIGCLTVILAFGSRFYGKTNRSLKHLSATTRSPILKHINDSLHGLSTIRASRAEDFFMNQFEHHQDIHTSSYSLHMYSVWAFRQYIDVISLLFMVIICYTFVYSDCQNTIGNVGLIITQAFALNSILRLGTFKFLDLDGFITSVERVLEFNHIQQEPALETSIDKMPPKDWPQKGCVMFKDVFLKYYRNEDPVLKNLSFIVQPKEKIGIVGRTGAGKSSLVAALFRLAHIEGEIIIDGVSTSDLGLYHLRSKISIIPQQPFLFSGSLRRNLDPFEEYSDAVVWQALEDVELKKAVADLADGLVTKVSDGGLNFSVGQRQLLCLARAIVKQNKILVLDEATANVDAETDSLIQKTIRKRFENCTVLIIAHRLNTIMDCDKCMVIDSGRIVEFDEPSSLLDQKEGFLYDMVQQTGTETAALLERLAQCKNI